MSRKDHSPEEVNKNGVSVSPDGSGYYDSSLFPANSVAGVFIPPGATQDIVSATDMTGAYPTMYPRAEFPDYDNFKNLGIKS